MKNEEIAFSITFVANHHWELWHNYQLTTTQRWGVYNQLYAYVAATKDLIQSILFTYTSKSSLTTQSNLYS